MNSAGILSLSASERTIGRYRKLAKSDLFYFARNVLGYDKLTERVHRPVCEKLQDLALKRVLICMPRTFFKSTLGSVAYPLWRAVGDPNVTILIAMNTELNAKQKLREIRSHVERNQLFGKLFPEIIPDFNSTPWGELAASVRRTVERGTCTWEAAGAGAAVMSRHYDEIVEDDLVTIRRDEITGDEIVASREGIERGIAWHRMSHSMLNDQKKGRIINIGTRQAAKDLILFLLETSDEFAANSVMLKAEQDGQPTFPEYYDEKVLKSLKRSLGSNVYSLWYLNEPIDPQEIVFKICEDHFYDPRSVNLDGLPHFTGVDLAVSHERRASYTALITVAVTPDNRRYVRDIRYGHFSPLETIDLLFAIHTMYHPQAIGIESVSYQAFLPRLMPYLMRERGQMLQLRELPRDTTVAKEQRNMALQPWLENRAGGLPMLLLPRGAKELVHELEDFRLDRKRRGRTDLLDALCDAMRLSEAGLAPMAIRLQRQVILTDEQRARYYDIEEGVKELIGASGKTQMSFERQLKGTRFSYLARAN